MYKRILFSLLLVLLITSVCFSQSRGLGLGLVFGDPTGFNGKAWMSQSGAFQFGVGMPSLSNSSGTAFNAEYIWHSHVIRSQERFPIFYGLGGIIGTGGGHTAIGARGILGIAWWPHNTPIDVFFQMTPTLFFDPSNFEFDFGIGARYFF